MFHAIVFLFFFIATSHCHKHEGSSPEKPSAPQERPVTEQPPLAPATTTDLQVELRADDAPNVFRVHLRWNANATSGWLINRQELGEQTPRILVLLGPEVRDFEDSTIRPGTRYHYGLLDSSTGNRFAQAEVLVPTDLEVQGQVHLHELHTIHRLFLRPQSLIVTDGSPVNFVVNELRAEGGAIASFPPNQTAPPHTDGRGGGTIRIRAHRGTGRLVIFGRGENGGEGLPSPVSGTPGNKGVNGKGGLCAHKWFDEGKFPFDPCSFTNEGLFHYWDNFPTYIRTALEQNFYGQYYCKTQPTEGGVGAVGGVGGKGNSGHRGGDSAEISVEIEQANEMKVEALVIPGLGGLGGDGGPGGPGGPGGDGGTTTQPTLFPICLQSSRSGPQGPTGPTGPRGDSGPAGKQLGYCLKLGNATQGDCKLH